ncbi:MAG: DUF2207 domain-containing protein, partial [Gaiellales bacterium]
MSPSPFTQRSHRLPSGMLPRAITVLLITAVIALVGGVVASTLADPERVIDGERSYGLPSAEISVDVRANGELAVLEVITFDFAGRFRGAFRDIPLRKGDSISHIAVCGKPDATLVDGEPDETKPAAPGCPRGETGFVPGASTKLGATAKPGTFGTKRMENPVGTGEPIPYRQRIVWHYDAANTQRDFTLSYRAKGLVRRVAGSDDMLAIELTPWGNEWNATMQQLRAEVRLPVGASITGDELEVYASSPGAARVQAEPRVEVGGKRSGATVAAADLEIGERLDLLMIVPAAAAGIDAAVLPVTKYKLDELRRLARKDVDHSRAVTKTWASTRQHTNARLWQLPLLGLLLAAAFSWLAWTRDLREDPWPADVDRFLNEPPTTLRPALSVSLIEQRSSPASTALVATIFDLIRRGWWST